MHWGAHGEKMYFSANFPPLAPTGVIISRLHSYTDRRVRPLSQVKSPRRRLRLLNQYTPDLSALNIIIEEGSRDFNLYISMGDRGETVLVQSFSGPH